MKIVIPTNNKNILDKKYGGYGPKEVLINGEPRVSFPINWSNFKHESHFVHIILIDYDSNPVCGFTYFHWGIANLDLNEYPNGLDENISLNKKDILCQAINSSFIWNKNTNESIGYYGPFPPNCPHVYTMYLITTKELLNLHNGWMINDIVRQLEKTQIIEWKKINFTYKNF